MLVSGNKAKEINMKKIITILVIGMMILSLSACGADKKNASLTLNEGVLTVAISRVRVPATKE